MALLRRAVLAAAPALLATPGAWAAEAPPPLAAYERETGGRIGLFARNLGTGATLAWRADERFVMCSTFKASLAALVLSRAQAGHERLDRIVRFRRADLQEYAPVARQNLSRGSQNVSRGSMTVAELCAGAVSWSDNTCANLLLAACGGPAALTRFWRSLGDATSRLDHNEPQLNRSPPGDPHDTTTPAAMAGNLGKLLLAGPLSPENRARLTGWMIDCKTGDNRLRGGLPKTWRIADKTGNNGKDASGDIALVWPKPAPSGSGRPVVVCAYTQGGAPKPERIAAVFADIGRMVGQRLA